MDESRAFHGNARQHPIVSVVEARETNCVAHCEDVAALNCS